MLEELRGVMAAHDPSHAVQTEPAEQQAIAA
jgi:hypothetical protein